MSQPMISSSPCLPFQFFPHRLQAVQGWLPSQVVAQARRPFPCVHRRQVALCHPHTPIKTLRVGPLARTRPDARAALQYQQAPAAGAMVARVLAFVLVLICVLATTALGASGRAPLALDGAPGASLQPVQHLCGPARVRSNVALCLVSGRRR